MYVFRMYVLCIIWPLTSFSLTATDFHPNCFSSHSALLPLRSELADLVLLVLLRAQLGEPVLQLAPPLLLDGRLRDRVELQQAVRDGLRLKPSLFTIWGSMAASSCSKTKE